MCGGTSQLFQNLIKLIKLVYFVCCNHRIPLHGEASHFAHIGGNSARDELLVDTVSTSPQGVTALMAASVGFRLFSVGL